jgi:hypothetical protein
LIQDPENSENQLQQLNGQLMGSVTSFPILCIANLALCRYSLEVDRRQLLTLKNAPLSVNGDDAIMRIGTLGKTVWEKSCRRSGLSPSVGKVYYSKEFLNINSTTYDFSSVYPFENSFELRKNKDGSFSEVHRPLYFREVRYVNLGLLFGLKRSGGKVDIAEIGMEIGSLGARARDLISKCPVPMQEVVMTSFINNHSKLLRESRVPWFLPEKYGGLGLPSIGRWKPDDRELRLARKIYESDIKVPMKPVSAPWKVWQYATKRYNEMHNKQPVNFDMVYEFAPQATSAKDFSYLNDEYVNNGVVAHSHESEDDVLTSEMSVLGMLCVEALFTVKSVKKLYDTKKTKDTYLGQLRDMWKKLRKGKYPEPFNLDNLPVLADFSNLNLHTLHKSELKQHLITQLGNDDIAYLTLLYASTQLNDEEREFTA